MSSLEERIEKIEERNNRVEADKAWEGSKMRKLVIIVFTYIAIGILLTVLRIDRPWLSAIIPSCGFLLSTLTLPFIKDWWKKEIYKK